MLKRFVTVFLSCVLVCSNLVAQEENLNREELIRMKLELIQQKEAIQKEIDAINEKLAIPFYCKEDNQLYGKIGTTLLGVGVLYVGLRDARRINIINQDILNRSINTPSVGQSQGDRPFVLKGDELEATERQSPTAKGQMETVTDKKPSKNPLSSNSLFQNQSKEFSRLYKLSRIKILSGFILTGVGLGSMFVDLDEAFNISCGDAKNLVVGANNVLEDFEFIEKEIDQQLSLAE